MAKTPKAPKVVKTVNPSLKMVEFTASSVADAITATGAKKSGKLLLVPIDMITEVPGFNLRVETPEYKTGLEDLCQSILLEGYYESKPLSGFAADIDGEARIVVIDGHRRFAAAKMAIEAGADIETLPVVLTKPTATDLDLAVMLHKANAAVPLTMLERAVLAHRMLRAGLSEAEAAERLQVTERHISDLKVIIAAPKAVRDLIRDGKVSPTEAIAQLRKDPTGAKILEAAEKAEAKAADSSSKAKEAKVTRQTIEGEVDARKVKMQVHRANFKVTEGAEFEFADAAPFFSIIGDETWFKPARKKAFRVALCDLSIEVVIRRPKTDDEVAAEKAAADAKAAASKPPAGKDKNGKNPSPEADDGLDAGLDDDGLDDAGTPDLKSLGIAEPAGDDL